MLIVVDGSKSEIVIWTDMRKTNATDVIVVGKRQEVHRRLQ